MQSGMYVMGMSLRHGTSRVKVVFIVRAGGQVKSGNTGDREEVGRGNVNLVRGTRLQ